MLIKNENSYLTVAEFDDIKQMDFIISPDFVVSEKDLINGALFMDTMFNFGKKKDSEQTLNLPSVNFDKQTQINLLAARIAFYLKSDVSITKKSEIEAQVKKEKMDVFETEYFENKSSGKTPFLDKLDIHTRKLVESNLSLPESSIIKTFSRF